MHKRDGFTIIEVAVAMLIIGVLLTVAVVSFRGIQVAARDKEREADIQAIVNYLESVYPQEIRNSSGQIIKPANSYPALQKRGIGIGDNMTIPDYMIEAVDPAALRPPGSKQSGVGTFDASVCRLGVAPCYFNSPYAYDYAANATVDTYFYAPRAQNSDTEPVCEQEYIVSTGGGCRGFKLFYRLESKPDQSLFIEGRRK